jgi:DNA-directed RNA polymerase sigma subunit (sigma70/sigma32)
VISRILAKSKLKLVAGQPVPIEQIDAALDVPTDRFERTAEQIAAQLRRADADIDVVGYRARRTISLHGDTQPSMPDIRGVGFYQMDLRRLPPMDREEEFRMARRYEFFKLRLSLELQRVGVDAAKAKALVARPRSEIEAELGDRAQDSYLSRCAAQLEDLRNLYIEGALHIVLGTVQRYRGLGVDSPDLIQEGNASLFQAIEGFDWRREVRFRTYAQYWVQQAVLKMLYNSSRTVRIPVWVQKILGRIRRTQDEGRRAGREMTNAEIAQKLGISVDKVDWVLSTKRYAVSLDAERGGEDGAMTLLQSLADEEAVPVPESVPVGDLRASLADVMRDLSDREQQILRRRFGLGGGEPETLGQIAVDFGISAERVRQLESAALGRLKKPGAKSRLAAFVE